MRNVIIVEERFEARGTQRGLALPTAAFADSSSFAIPLVCSVLVVVDGSLNVCTSSLRQILGVGEVHVVIIIKSG